MQKFELDTTVTPAAREPVPASDVDRALTAQLIVAWAGEQGEDPRLGWWRSDLVSEFGGQDLFQRLLPATWAWATLQAAREAARRRDAALRARESDPDRIISLFHLGFAFDERIDERLQDLKRTGGVPNVALHGLDLVTHDWRPARFAEWVQGHGAADTETTSIGRRIKGPLPAGLDARVRPLVAALAPTGDAYPLPHYRGAP